MPQVGEIFIRHISDKDFPGGSDSKVLIALAPLVEEHSSRERTQEWHAGLVAPWRVGSASPKDQTHSSCIGKQTPNYWTSRESTGLKI